MLGATRGHDAPLVGRPYEQHLLTSLLDEAPTRGQFLLLQGEPGIGKSRLLLEAERTARDRGMTVLKTLGVQCESHLPFAGLHQLLRPVHKRAADLGDVQRAALDAAFGRTPDAAPALFKIAMAVLDLLSEVATEAPLVVIVEDAHWLDRPTSEVLAFVARRIESDPIVILAAIRDGYSSPLAESGLPGHTVSGLDETSAAALIDEMAPGLPAVVRTRVMREAGGNPLAILELPAAVDSDDTRWPTGGVPLTSRLERAFADRVSTLPDETQLVLLVAALSDGERLGEILDASALVAGTAVAFDVVGPAADAGIVYADLQTIHFRHPLVRSAIAQSAGVAERRRVHEAMAEVLHDQPDRRVWQRAALLSGEHEAVACELQEAGARGRQQGRGCDSRHGAATRRRTRGAGASQSTDARRRRACRRSRTTRCRSTATTRGQSR